MSARYALSKVTHLLLLKTSHPGKLSCCAAAVAAVLNNQQRVGQHKAALESSSSSSRCNGGKAALPGELFVVVPAGKLQSSGSQVALKQFEVRMIATLLLILPSCAALAYACSSVIASLAGCCSSITKPFRCVRACRQPKLIKQRQATRC